MIDIRLKSKPLYYLHCLPKICIHRRFHFQLQGYHYFCTIVYCSFFISKRTFSASILVCRNCNLEGQMPHQSQVGSQYILGFALEQGVTSRYFHCTLTKLSLFSLCMEHIRILSNNRGAVINVFQARPALLLFFIYNNLKGKTPSIRNGVHRFVPAS